MLHTTLSAPRREEALATLDHLMASVAQFHDDPSNVLREHLQSAREYLLGAMRGERLQLVNCVSTAGFLTS